jgi:3-hydroxyisobutyrate dehydrogenase-like beta-hydroxyacid dehydrogenase
VLNCDADLAAEGQRSIGPAGPTEVVDRMLPLFKAMSKQIFRAGGQPQASAAVKIANNFMLDSNFATADWNNPQG